MIKKLVILLLVIMNISCSHSGKASAEDDFLLELAQNRRSIRRYTSQPISRETMDSILSIAALAPSSYGQNPVEFVVVEGKDLLAKLADCKGMGAPSVKNATAAVVVMADRQKGELWVEDTSVAAAYLLLAAQEHGLGACWNQIHLRNGRHDSAGREICRLLGIPLHYEVCCVVAMGYPAEDKAPRNVEKMKKDRIHYVTE